MSDYIGSGPYCYANSLAMVLGPGAPSPAVIETLTGSPFGAEMIGGTLPFFDPYGWDPETGLDDAIALLGRTCERTTGGTSDEALARLRDACARGPVLAGPLDMGLLLYHPGTPWGPMPGGSDHYVVVVEADGDTLVLHDPHGHPYATLPAADFVAAWRGDTVIYCDESYVMRAGFTVEREVAPRDALRAALPGAVAWLGGRTDRDVPPGTLGGAEAVEELARQLLEDRLAPGIHDMLAHFAVRVGVRRLADASTCLAELGLAAPADVLSGQARLLGAFQHPLVRGDAKSAAAVLHDLAPTYDQLRRTLPPKGTDH
ncbi:hypothetical protein GCM10009801_33590 [Streptomyces albiaxialis]|uniref:Peptidase C39-like domain-containing protein n=1 Tax=Streptomyces albiaxialis TaxID=329523 RepID=A0ABP5HHX7_9ACTN